MEKEAIPVVWYECINHLYEEGLVTERPWNQTSATLAVAEA